MKSVVPIVREAGEMDIVKSPTLKAPDKFKVRRPSVITTVKVYRPGEMDDVVLTKREF